MIYPCYDNYSLVLIELKPALKGQKERFDRYRLKLTPPSSDLNKKEQIFPRPDWIRVPKDGVLQLELFSADEPYQVELYHQKQSLPLASWEWLIPPPQPEHTTHLNYQGKPLPLPVYDRLELVSVSHDYEITKDGKIDFPNCSECQVTLTYKKAYTLEEITVDNGPFSFDYGPISRDPRREIPYGYRFW